MKRLATLVLALCLTLGAASQASAIEVVPSGVMDFVFAYTNSYDFSTHDDTLLASDEGLSDRFVARQRSRIQIDFIANENLRGVLMLQFGRGADGVYEWGRSGNALDTTSTSPYVRRLFIDFNLPDSSVNMKMGLMDLVLPYATFGQPVLGNHVAAVTLTANVTDNAALTAFWARPLRDGTATKDNDMDVFGVWANLDFDSFTIAPWAAYASVGTNSGWFEREGLARATFSKSDAADWWGVGAAVKIMPTDALTIKFDAMYAAMDTGDAEIAGEELDIKGYYFALAVDYAMDWGTPGVFAIYSSGDKAEDGVSKSSFHRIPGLAYDDNVYATRMAFAGSMTCANDTYISAAGIGLWMIGVQIADLSFIENVNHTARLAYIRGTNHIDSATIRGLDAPALGGAIPLAKEDAAWEVGFDTYWQMYENLTVGLELGYINLDMSDKRNRDDHYNEDSVYSANLIFRFGF